MKIIEKCPKCGNRIEYLSEVHLIPITNPQEAGIGGECEKCNVEVYHKFRIYEIEIKNYDENGNEIPT